MYSLKNQSLIVTKYEHQRKELVDLVNIIETRTRGGEYEVTDFESDSLQEVSENSVERTEAD